MATNPDYLYNPVYGVEPYAALGVPESAQVGGGCDVTNRNLLRTIWTIDNEEFGAPVAGSLLKPASAFGDYFKPISNDVIVGFPTAGFKQSFNSRYAARFLLSTKGSQLIDFPLMAILSPPAEYRQALVGALEAVVAATPIGGSLIVKKSVMQFASWNIFFQSGDLETMGVATNGSAEVGGVVNDLPIYRTDGSDGNYPIPLKGPFNALNLAELQEMIAHIDSGAPFYVPVVLETTETSPMITIEWPYSPGRG